MKISLWTDKAELTGWASVSHKHTWVKDKVNQTHQRNLSMAAAVCSPPTPGGSTVISPIVTQLTGDGAGFQSTACGWTAIGSYLLGMKKGFLRRMKKKRKYVNLGGNICTLNLIKWVGEDGCLQKSACADGACLEVLAGDRPQLLVHPWPKNHPPLSGKVIPSVQVQEGRTWNGEGGRGHLPSQPDQPNPPRWSMGWRCHSQITPTLSVC